MKKAIITAIQNTFSLENVTLEQMQTSHEIYSVYGLSKLISLLADSSATQKQIGSELDAVMVHIKLKSKLSPKELMFTKEINALVYEPMYEQSSQDEQALIPRKI